MNQPSAASFLLALLLAPGFSVPSAEPPSAQDLAGSARVVSLEDKTLTTYKVTGVLSPGTVRLRFIVAGCQTRGVAIRLEDARDGSPIMVSAGGTTVLYDPLSAETLVFPSRGSFKLAMEAKEVDGQTEHDLIFRFNLQNLMTDKPEPTRIDIPSMLAAVVPPLRVKPEEGGGYLLAGQSRKGNRLAARMDPGRKEGEVAWVGLFEKDAPPDQSILELHEILLNPALPDTLFKIPEEKLAGSGLPLKRLKDAGDLETLLSIGKVIRALIFRLCLVGDVPDEVRAQMEKAAGRKLDWEALRKADQEAARKLKAVFADPPEASGP